VPLQPLISTVAGWSAYHRFLRSRRGQVLDIRSITKRHCRIVACSAVEGTGLLEGFDFVVKDISSRIYLFS
jgi:hypothetical protein